MSYDDEEIIGVEFDAEEELDLISDVGDDALEDDPEEDVFAGEDDDLAEEFAGLDGSTADYL